MHDVYGQTIPRYILASLHTQSWSVVGVVVLARKKGVTRKRIESRHALQLMKTFAFKMSYISICLLLQDCSTFAQSYI